MVLISLNASVFETHAESISKGGAGGPAIANKSGSESYPCYGTCNYYPGPNAASIGGPGGPVSNQSPPLSPSDSTAVPFIEYDIY